VAPAAETARLPLRQRLSDELQGRQAFSAFDAGGFDALLHKCDLAVAAMNREEYRHAKRLLESLLTDLELQYRFTDSYYPRIVYGAALLGEAHAGSGSFREAEEHFAGLIHENHPDLDANAFLGRGNALAAMDRYEEALASYDIAESYLSDPDAALLYNVVRTRVLGGVPMHAAEIEHRRSALELGVVTKIPGDLARLTSSLALAYAFAGHTAAARRMWGTIENLDDVYPELVIDLGEQLRQRAIEARDRSGLEGSLSVVSSFLAKGTTLSDVQVLQLQHFRARLLSDRGDLRSARRELSDLVSRCPASPVLGVDAAMLAIGDHDVATGRRMCESVLRLTDASHCKPPLSSQAFNFSRGQAFWLQGKRHEAAESFRRSGYGARFWYEATMQEMFGALS
jgi:tetratricopeptide (TPR) repeat protein